MGIAVAILAAEGHIPHTLARQTVCCGELGLDGRLHPVRGVAASVLAGHSAGFKHFIVPQANLHETDIIPQIRAFGANNLAEVVNALGGAMDVPDLPPLEALTTPVSERYQVHDLSEVCGQADAKYGLALAAAGGHHLMMSGVPGAGKTLLASCLPSILPPLDTKSACEVLALHSLAGTIDTSQGAPRTPPFAAPHHRTTASAMVGGWAPGAIGVFSRAHNGVLFMDEAPEFSRDVIEALRQPLESGHCDIHRVWGSVVLPARFQLVLAANPCPCGGTDTQGNDCSCKPADKRRYRQKISGPVMDRIDLHMELLPISAADLRGATGGEGSEEVRSRVVAARERQRQRYSHVPWNMNAHAPGEWLRKYFGFPNQHTRSLDSALERGIISMRGYDRIIRVATTIADYDGKEAPDKNDLMAALVLRTQDRGML